MPAKKVHGFQVLLEPDLTKKLEQLAAYAHCSAGHIVRELLRCSWSSTFTTARYCTSGARCPFPNTTPPADIPTPRPPDPELPFT